MLTLNSKQVRFLRSASHDLNPVVMIGNNGLTETVLKEIDRSLTAHELIKIKVAGDERELRVQLYEEICEQLGAAQVQHIGKQLVIYRPAKEPKIVLPKN
ncbi:RNA-binding protein [Novimethylophilus kurashikiensis]|uniref:RNA-binding protein n=1 Tax=Novimethylophilus kurashikiensis TaxID=1825523 RepID=A0A2R5F4A0_9PROT|nr:ribosome assembly RNA-binding protein YhbY [Novimethylophilus kurashikiensis]GBG13247.1 RNA-binding protein [Novimethylophilus kurashikiensis]